jgi:hypothetical protein
LPTVTHAFANPTPFPVERTVELKVKTKEGVEGSTSEVITVLGTPESGGGGEEPVTETPSPQPPPSPQPQPTPPPPTPTKKPTIAEKQAQARKKCKKLKGKARAKCMKRANSIGKKKSRGSG